MVQDPRREPAGPQPGPPDAAPPAPNGREPEASIPPPVPLDALPPLPRSFGTRVVRPINADGVLLSRRELEERLREVWFPNLTSIRPLDLAGEEYLVRLQQSPAEGGAR